VRTTVVQVLNLVGCQTHKVQSPNVTSKMSRLVDDLKQTAVREYL